MRYIAFSRLLPTTAVILACFILLASMVKAAPPGAQVFEVYDETNNGLDVSVDPDVGNVEFNANPGGQPRLVIEAHLQKAAPNCEYTVELVVDSEASNGGLDEIGHTGVIRALGVLTTNRAGNGNAHFDYDLSNFGDGTTQMWGHLDFEDPTGTCTEADGTTVQFNEYGATFDPLADTPVTWWE
jgi:hypothetical protein